MTEEIEWYPLPEVQEDEEVGLRGGRGVTAFYFNTTYVFPVYFPYSSKYTHTEHHYSPFRSHHFKSHFADNFQP